MADDKKNIPDAGKVDNPPELGKVEQAAPPVQDQPAPAKAEAPVVEDASPVVTPPLAAEQQLQHLELLAAQAQGGGVAPQRKGRAVQGDVSARQDAGRVGLAAPRQRPHPRQERPVVEGLGQVVVRAAVQARDPVLDLALGRQQEHRGGYVFRPQRARISLRPVAFSIDNRRPIHYNGV